MARGIVNPYYKPPPKKDRPTIYDREPADTEAEIGIRPVSTRLDGDRFVIEFTGIEYENIRKELISLLSEIYAHHDKGLLKYGIRVLSDLKDYVTNKEEMVLHDSGKYLVVFVGTSPKESTVINRLGFALTQLPVQGILDKHQARILLRG